MLRNVIGILLISLGAFQGSVGDKRTLVFPQQGEKVTATKVQFIIGIGLPMEVDVSLIIGYTMKFNYLLPSNASYFTDPYVRYDRSIDRHIEPYQDDDNQVLSHEKGGVMSRWELYGILESALRSGKACLLRTICETAYAPFNRDLGLTSQLLHAFLTPSTTKEPIRTEFDKEYRAAEEAGKKGDRSCENLFPECKDNYLDYFTDIY